MAKAELSTTEGILVEDPPPLFVDPQNEQDVSYMNSELIRFVLLNMVQNDESKRDLFQTVRRQAKKEETDNAQHVAEQFVSTYKSQGALEFYTEESFVFRALNTALRQPEEEGHLEFLYGVRHFLIDLMKQLEQLHLKNFDVSNLPTLHRGLTMENTMLKQLLQSIGKLLFYGQFLSTSLDESVAKNFIKKATREKSQVLYHIDITTCKNLAAFGRENPLAYIRELSQRRYEEEVLLSPASVFRILKIEPSKQDKIWHVFLQLTVDRDMTLRNLYEHNVKEMHPYGEATHLVTWGKLLRRLGKLELAKKYYLLALEDPILGKHDAYRITIHTDLAIVYRQCEDYESSMKETETAETVLRTTDCSPTSHSYRKLVNNKAIVYREKFHYENNREHLRKEQECWSNLLAMMEKDTQANPQQIVDDRGFAVARDREHATYANNYAVSLSNMGKYKKALKLFEYALSVLQQTLPANHWEIGRTYTNMSRCCLAVGRDIEAVDYGKMATTIMGKALPSGHHFNALAMSSLGLAQKKSGDVDQAYSNLDAAYESILAMRKRSDEELKYLARERDSIPF